MKAIGVFLMGVGTVSVLATIFWRLWTGIGLEALPVHLATPEGMVEGVAAGLVVVMLGAVWLAFRDQPPLPRR